MAGLPDGRMGRYRARQRWVADHFDEEETRLFKSFDGNGSRPQSPSSSLPTVHSPPPTNSTNKEKSSWSLLHLPPPMELLLVNAMVAVQHRVARTFPGNLNSSMPGLINQPSSSSSSSSMSVLSRFHHLTLNTTSAQSALLLRILIDNASCDYLRRLPGSDELLRQLSRIHQQHRPDPSTAPSADAPDILDGEHLDDLLDTFRKVVPLVTHSDIRPFIDRIANSDRQFSQGILTAAPLEGLCLSSGTTDAKPKYLPYHEGLRNGTVEVGRVAAAFRSREFPVDESDGEGRILELLFCGQLTTTSGGLIAGTASTHMIRSGAFSRRQSDAVGLRPCTPLELILAAPDSRQAMYCHLLAGLIHADNVQIISAPFAYTLVEAFRALQILWPRLCHDIRSGTLDAEIVSDAALRSAAAGSLLLRRHPDAALADRLSGTFLSLANHPSSSWRAAVPSIWPRCKYVLSILTGAMEPYAAALSTFAAHVPLVSADYAATEGWIGVNISPSSPPSSVSFTIHPSLAFFEFIPLYRRCASHPAAAAYDEGAPVRLAHVCIGQEYEIVMTTAWGLYRYRLGDIVRVTGFYNAAPQVQYVCRRNVLLSINIDKVTEMDVKVAVEAAMAAANSKIEVVDYTSYAEKKAGMEGVQGNYVVFWELGDPAEEELVELQQGGGEGERRKNVLARCATAMDMALCSEMGYATSRKMGNIGALELCVVGSGTFSKLLERYLTRGTAAITQYKTPRCLNSAESFALLRSCAVASLFSAATFF